MTTKPKPTLFIVHGGWHVPESYKKLTRALESQGYEVHLPRLPSVNGARPPNADLSTDTLLIRSYVESLVRTGRIVVVIMHSYGGLVGSNALHGLGLEARAKQSLAGGVSKLIYLTAYLVPEGVSAMDKNREFGSEHLVPVVMDIADDNTCLWRDPKGLMIGPWPDEAEVEENANTFVRWNMNALNHRPENAAWREIPFTYTFTTLDMTLPLSYQQSMVELVQKSGYEPRIYELETGHCPHLTATERVVEIVNEVING
ncbi:Alpha/beta hydrolase fold-1 [Xylaria intraflava]|nr:Alpha/beta hydrolase fold-1 [Xylaria intraflava]